MKTTNGNRKITTEDALRMMRNMSSGVGGASSLEDLGVNASADELNFVKGVTSNIQEQLNGKASVSEIFPVGSVYVTNTNKNPASHFGGEWELVTKELKDAVYSSANLNFVTMLNASSADVYISTSGNTINVELGIVTAAELGESSVKWIEIDWSKVGITGFPWSQRFMLYSDGANGVAYGTCHYNDKSIMTNDFLSKTGSAIASGATIYGSFNFTMTKDYLLDEYCDKFYWKRTA